MKAKKLWIKLFIIATIKILILVYVVKPLFFPKFKDRFESKEDYKEFSIEALTDTENSINQNSLNRNSLKGGK